MAWRRLPNAVVFIVKCCYLLRLSVCLSVCVSLSLVRSESLRLWVAKDSMGTIYRDSIIACAAGTGVAGSEPEPEPELEQHAGGAEIGAVDVRMEASPAGLSDFNPYDDDDDDDDDDADDADDADDDDVQQQQQKQQHTTGDGDCDGGGDNSDESEANWRHPVLVLLPLKLGLGRYVNPRYIPALAALFRLPQVGRIQCSESMHSR